MDEETDMSVHMVIELRNRAGAQTVLQALAAYKVRLRTGIERTKQRLAEFEARCGAGFHHWKGYRDSER